MKSILRLTRRFVFTMLAAVAILLVMNSVLFISVAYQGMTNGSGWKEAMEVSAALTRLSDGGYLLQPEGAELLEEKGVWAILVQDGTGNVIWQSENLPEGIPMRYSAAAISQATRGYIADYPVTTADKDGDLVILGHPKERFWKLMWNTFDFQTVAGFPRTALLFLFINIGCIFLIYLAAVSGVLRSVRPIVDGIAALPEGGDVYIREKGLLADLAAAINRAAEKLRMQERELRKKETARANWIAGVSHDIRTPLSMVMGYAGQLEESPALPEEERRKAGVIRLQSIKMKNLVNDLNLSSKLEYNMQPLHLKRVNLLAVVRQVVVDFLNLDLEERYPLEWSIEEGLTACMIDGDEDLLRRAMNNLLANAQIHNPGGCMIAVTVNTDGDTVEVAVEDNGVGVTDKQLDILQKTPHYMMSDGSGTEQRHGLGLLIVRQIAEAHQGSVAFGHGRDGGFAVTMRFPYRETGKV